jgi:hypothetical protein
MKSVLATKHMIGGGGYSENSSMGSLQLRYKTLSQLVPDVQPEDMVHVIGGVFCPVSVLHGNPGVHTSNGVYVARRLSLDVVYASCAHCVLSKGKKRLEEVEGNGRPFLGVEILVGSEDMQYPWVAYTRENYPRIITASLANAPSSRTHTTAQNSNVKAKIPKKRKLVEQDEDKTP